MATLGMKLLSTFVLILVTLLQSVENKSTFGIGMRIMGDQLLLKDVQDAPPTGLEEHPTIEFNYAIPEPITYIEIQAEQNILGEVNFSYQNDLVKGVIVAANTSLSQPLAVLIRIYGFNETMLNVNPAYILNRDQQFEGTLLPEASDEMDIEEDDEYLNASEEAFSTTNAADDDMEDENFEEEDEDDQEQDEDRYDIDTDFDQADKVFELGHRQKDDYLLYETYQTSATSSEVPTNHSVVFYYVDSNFISYVKFVVFDEDVDKLSPQYNPPVAEFSHFSPTTLKAVITDSNATHLFVQMSLYGYKPIDLPLDYVAMLPRAASNTDTGTMKADATESPLSPLQRLKMLMKAEQQNPTPNTNESDEQNVLKELKADTNKVVACLENVNPNSGVQNCFTYSSITLTLLIVLWNNLFMNQFL